MIGLVKKGFLQMLRLATLALLVAGTALWTTASADELRIVGTGDGIELLRNVAAKFNERSPGTEVVVPDSIGSGGGIAAVTAGAARVARVARVLKPSEEAIGLQYLPFARIPSVFFAHPSAGVTSVTSEQVRAIFEGKVRSWADVGGNDVKIRVVRREDGDSTLLVLRESMPGWKDLTFTERSKMAVTTQDAVSTVRTVPGAIGFAPYTEVYSDEVAILAVDGLLPTDPGYPSAGELALVFRSEDLTPDVRSFIDFAGSAPARTLMLAEGALPSS